MGAHVKRRTLYGDAYRTLCVLDDAKPGVTSTGGGWRKG